MKLQIYIINKITAGLVLWGRNEPSLWLEAGGHIVLASDASSGMVLERRFDPPDPKESVPLFERPGLPSQGRVCPLKMRVSSVTRASASLQAGSSPTATSLPGPRPGSLCPSGKKSRPRLLPCFRPIHTSAGIGVRGPAQLTS